MSFSLDVESRSPVNLKTAGMYVYFEHPDTDVMIASWSVKGGPRGRWRLGEPCPPILVEQIEAGETIFAWNAGFERRAIWDILAPRYGWPRPRLEQFVCTAAAAAALGLPRALKDAAPALGVPVEKDAEGKRLMLRMAKPRPARKGEDPNGLYWYGWDDEALVERLARYCDRDVEVEEAIAERIVPLSPAEQELYWLDQRINDRGIRLDRLSAAGAVQLAERSKAVLDREMALVTGGYVSACSKVLDLTAWVQEQGVDMASAGKADIVDLLEADDLPERVRRALEIRQEAAKTSVKKIDAMRARACADGRIRGSFLFHAAGTGRWSSTGAQLHNMPRPRKVFEDAHVDYRLLFEKVRGADPAELAGYGVALGRPLHLLSDAVRGFLWAAPGHELVVADFSSIEGRLAAWFADEEWKLEAFTANDRGDGPGMYELAAAGIYNVGVDAVDKAQRQVGKVAELALGYQGGVGAFYTMSRGYGLKLETAYPPVWASAGAERREAAVDRYDECVERNDRTAKLLSREAWLAAELVKVGWRATHPDITGAWKALQQAARDAVEQPGLQTTTLGGRVSYVVRRGFLWCRLPSGRCLAYGGPSIRQVEAAWANPEDPPEKREKVSAVTALGVNSVTKRWERYPLYGGLLFENCLGPDTEVLTEDGWLRLIDVHTGLRVWDGVQWVCHSGLVYQGCRKVIDFGGVTITPDHKVITQNGWEEARSTSHSEAVNEFEAWYVVPSSLRSVAFDVGPLPPTISQSLRALWREGHYGLRRLAARLHELLARHGAELQTGADARSAGQQRGLLADELRLARPHGAGPEHARQSDDRHAVRTDARVRGRGDQRHRQDDVAVPLSRRVAGEQDVRPAGLHQPRRVAHVFDLLNAGPRRRFTVRGTDGRPFIVSNCVQAAARDLLANGMLKAEAAGYPVIGHVHDEIITERRRGEGDVAEFERLICELPAWAAGLPLRASGFKTKRYKK